MNIQNLKQYIDEGYISVSKHPAKYLFIYNYTQKTQYEQFWNETTLQCRGLVLDINYKVIARPFNKFFNIEELDENEIPDGDFEVFEKMDGSLIIMFFYENDWIVCSRGSFVSDQAIKAKEIINRRYKLSCLNDFPNYTFLFEIIYPENRIVVDYGNETSLYLLTAVNILNGQELKYSTLESISYFIQCRLVKRYDGINDFRKIRELNETNKEGFVIRFLKNNYRLKMKYEEYVRLHKVLTGISNKMVWEYLRDGRDINELLVNVPDEFYKWIKAVVTELEYTHDEILVEIDKNFKDLGDRKATSEYFKTLRYSHLYFAKLDKRNLNELVWKIIKPEKSITMRCN